MKHQTSIPTRTILCGSLLRALARGVKAGDENNTGPHPWSISLAGGFQHLGLVDRSSNVGANTYNVYGDLGVGYFLTDHIKLEGSLGAQSSGNDNGFNNGNLSYLVASKYYV